MSLSSVPTSTPLSAADALFMVQNPDKLAAVIKTMKDQQDALDARIALAGDADQIVALKAQAEKDANTAAAARDAAMADAAVAKQKVVDAQAQAAGIMADANTSARAVRDAAAADAASSNGAIADAYVQLAADKAAAAGRSADLDAREAVIAERESIAEQAIAAAAASKSAYEARQAALTAALKGV